MERYARQGFGRVRGGFTAGTALRLAGGCTDRYESPAGRSVVRHPTKQECSYFRLKVPTSILLSLVPNSLTINI